MGSVTFDIKVIDAMCELASHLQLQRFSAIQEKRTQMDVESFLISQGVQFEREKQLTSRDIPDFLVNHRGYKLVIECKIKAQRKAIYRQLVRYAEHPDVDGIILLTGTSMGLPSHINEKPAIIVSLGVGWL